MRVSILTLFPEYFQSSLSSSLLGRAQGAGLLSFDFVNLREFGEGKYRAVDDKPYGGGAGMVMMPTVLERALAHLLGGETQVDALEKDVAASRAGVVGGSNDTRAQANAGTLPLVVYLSPQGRKLDAGYARELATTRSHIVLICGHYEGIDERAILTLVHREVSIGDFILTGGEPAAAVLVDAMARFIPGVVGDRASVEGDTFEGSKGGAMLAGGLKYPVFTRPPVWRGQAIPEILTSGHHAEIAKWRRAESLARTQSRRPDLLRPSELTASKPGKPRKK